MRQEERQGSREKVTGRMTLAGLTLTGLGVVGGALAVLNDQRGRRASTRLEEASTPSSPPENRVGPLEDIRQANTRTLVWSIVGGTAGTLGIGLVVGAAIRKAKSNGRRRATAAFAPAPRGIQCVIRF